MAGIGAKVERNPINAPRRKFFAVCNRCGRPKITFTKGGMGVHCEACGAAARGHDSLELFRIESMEEFMAGQHKKCGAEGCTKYTVKDGLCYRHFKEKHGQAPGEVTLPAVPRMVAVPAPRPPKPENGALREMPSGTIQIPFTIEISISSGRHE